MEVVGPDWTFLGDCLKNLIDLFVLFYVHVLSANMSVHPVPAVPKEARRGRQVP